VISCRSLEGSDLDFNRVVQDRNRITAGGITHLDYGVPIGGVVAYRDAISPDRCRLRHRQRKQRRAIDMPGSKLSSPDKQSVDRRRFESGGRPGEVARSQSQSQVADQDHRQMTANLGNWSSTNSPAGFLPVSRLCASFWDAWANHQSRVPLLTHSGRYIRAC
jgi:hypothetical protein